MKYTLYAADHKLIHILRRIQSQNNDAVLGRSWQVSGEGIGFWETVNGRLVSRAMFSDFTPDNPLTVAGERLLERAALISDLDGNTVARYSKTEPRQFDMIIKSSDLGAQLIVETDDEVVFDGLYDYFELTSSESFRICFC